MSIVAFFESDEASEFAKQSAVLDQYFDSLMQMVSGLGAKDAAINIYELETRLQDEGTLSPEQLEVVMSSLVIPGQEFTSGHELEQMRSRFHNAAFTHYFVQFQSNQA